MHWRTFHVTGTCGHAHGLICIHPSLRRLNSPMSLILGAGAKGREPMSDDEDVGAKVQRAAAQAVKATDGGASRYGC